MRKASAAVVVIVALILSVSLAGLLAASPAGARSQNRPKSPEALRAISKFEAAEKKARQEYERAVKVAKDEAVKELTAAKSTVMKSGISTALDEANAIQGAIDGMTAKGGSAAVVDRTYTLHYRGTTTKITYRRDGTIECPTWPNPGKWEAVASDHLQQAESNGKVFHTVYLADGGRFAVWVFSTGPVCLAIAD